MKYAIAFCVGLAYAGLALCLADKFDLSLVPGETIVVQGEQYQKFYGQSETDIPEISIIIGKDSGGWFEVDGQQFGFEKIGTPISTSDEYLLTAFLLKTRSRVAICLEKPYNSSHRDLKYIHNTYVIYSTSNGWRGRYYYSSKNCRDDMRLSGDLLSFHYEKIEGKNGRVRQYYRTVSANGSINDKVVGEKKSRVISKYFEYLFK